VVVLINTPAGASSAHDNALSLSEEKKQRQQSVVEKVIPFDFFLLRLKNTVHLEK